MRLAALVLLAGLLQGCFPNAFHGEKAGALVARDRRSDEARRDDRDIEAEVAGLLYRQSKPVIHVNVTSFNRKVLLSGEVPTEAAKSDAEKIAVATGKVSEVFNGLNVADNSSLLSRSNDSLITSNVKLKLVADGRLDSNMVKVFVENGSVFLMGIVYRGEAETAAETASTVKGVRRVVKLFEYLN